MGITKIKWLVFYKDGKELLRYDLDNSAVGERQCTIDLLAYENECDAREITTKVEWR